MPYYRKRRYSRRRKYGGRPPKVRAKRGQRRALALVPYKNPRTFTGSVMCPQVENVFSLSHVAPSGLNMTTGQLSLGSTLYHVRANDLFLPWISTADGDGGLVSLDDAGDVQTLITGLNEAFDASSPSGYNRAACVACSQQLIVTVPPAVSYQEGAAAPVLENFKPFYITYTMATMNNASGLLEGVSSGTTMEEMRALPGIRMWKIVPGAKEYQRTLTITIPSVLQYIKGQWSADSAGTAVDFPTSYAAANIQNAMVRMDAARHILAQTNSTPFPSSGTAEKARIIEGFWGIWAPNANNEVTQRIRFSSRLKIIQKVRFYQSKDPALTTETV